MNVSPEQQPTSTLYAGMAIEDIEASMRLFNLVYYAACEKMPTCNPADPLGLFSEPRTI